MSQADKQKCRHPGCACEAPAGKEYCSEHCEQAAKKGSTQGSATQDSQSGCGCGHSACH
jgi:hypothetical protein